MLICQSASETCRAFVALEKASKSLSKSRSAQGLRTNGEIKKDR